MGKVAKSWAMLVLPLVGLGLVYVYPPAAVGVAFVGAFMVTFNGIGLNVPATRAASLVAILLNAAAVYLATGSWQLALALAPPLLTMIPNETVLRSNRDIHDFSPLVGLLAGGVMLGLAFPTLTSAWWALAVTPHLLFSAMMTMMMLGGRKEYLERLQRTKVQIGKPLPVEVKLPARDGQESFSLAEHVGQFVLLVFIRGDWCPVCHVMMRIISKERDTLTKHGVKVAIISPTEGQMEDEAVQQMGLDPGMLYDEDSNLARSLELLQKDKKDGKDVPLPVTLLIDKEGLVRHMSKPDDVTAYANEERVRAILASELAPA